MRSGNTKQLLLKLDGNQIKRWQLDNSFTCSRSSTCLLSCSRMAEKTTPVYKRQLRSSLWIINMFMNGVTSTAYSKYKAVEHKESVAMCCGKSLSTEIDQKV